MQYTSGTTSRPKAVLWTHANALWGAKVNAAHQDLHHGDVHQTYLPLFHTNALAYSMLACLWVGAACVDPAAVSASRFWNVRCQLHLDLDDSVLHEGAAGARDPQKPPIPAVGHRRQRPPPFAAFGIKIIGWWGMTETITHGIVGGSRPAQSPMSIGRAVSGICHPHHRRRRRADAGQSGTGNLLIKGVPGLSLFAEYLHNEKATP